MEENNNASWSVKQNELFVSVKKMVGKTTKQAVLLTQQDRYFYDQEKSN